MALDIAINVTSLLRPNMIKRNTISVVTGMVVEEIALSVKYIVRNVEDRLMYEKITWKPAFVRLRSLSFDAYDSGHTAMLRSAQIRLRWTLRVCKTLYETRKEIQHIRWI